MVRHFPALPPAHPAFRPLIASVPRLIEREGVRSAAARLREKIEAISAQASEPDRSFKKGVSAFDLAELLAWLQERVRDLEIAETVR
jgi:hypothetical protein